MSDTYNVAQYVATQKSAAYVITERRKAQRRMAQKWDSGRTAEDGMGGAVDWEG